jgi:hypothetical protein
MLREKISKSTRILFLVSWVAGIVDASIPSSTGSLNGVI